jgi:tripartite-type tricarboxylate transporter receptor subunit TctC
MRRFGIALFFVLSAAAVSSGAYAQNYPDRPIHFIVSYPPGGPADIVARAVAYDLSPRLGQQVVIENRGGANGNIGAQTAARAPADGYTLFMSTSSHAANVTLYRNLGYDFLKDFVHITNIASYPLILVVNPRVPAKSTAELIALAKSKPGQLSFASAGAGGGAHLAAELFKSMAGIDMLHVPYKGTAPALQDVVAGQVNVMFAGVSAAMPFVQSGQLRALGVSSRTRLRIAPDIPTISEAGLPGYQVASWLGISAPAGTPQAIVKRLNSEVAKVVTTPAFTKRLANDGSEPEVMSAEQFNTFVIAEVGKWAKVIHDAGVTLQ